MRGALIAVVMALAGSVAGAGFTAYAEQRIALVVGNGAYEVNAWRLDNPPRDARLMAQRLEALDFDVMLVTNASRTRLDDALSEYGRKIKRAGEDAVSFFYYAGHGAQHNGVNYLVPTDADGRTSDRLRFQSPALSFLLDDIKAAGNAVNLVVLDACRNMPLPDGTRSIGGAGLSDEGRPTNVLIAYATAPGSTAADGVTRNSPFTAALADHLERSASEPVSLLFENVGADVYVSTEGAQAPEFRNGLVRAPGWRLGRLPATTSRLAPRPNTTTPPVDDGGGRLTSEPVSSAVDAVSAQIAGNMDAVGASVDAGIAAASGEDAEGEETENEAHENRRDVNGAKRLRRARTGVP